MLKQIFRNNPPINIIFDILERICLKTDKYYLVDSNAYKKMIFHEYHLSFIEELTPYYQESKKTYIQRQLTYNSFVNIIRQVCKSNTVMFNSSIKYNKCKYNIDYFIYY